MKKFLAIFLGVTLSMIGVVSAYANDVMSIECNVEKSSVKIGDTFYADFKVTNNPTGYNSMTTYLKYDSNIIRAVECEVSDIPNDLITYKNDRGVYYSLFPYTFVNSRLNFVPKINDVDYDNKADGIKTASEIGILKLPAYLGQSVDGYLQNYEGTGTLLRVKFEAIGSGSTDIRLDNTRAAYFVQGKDYYLDTNVVNGSVNVVETTDINYGDVNEDGKLNLKDITTMNKYFAGWDIEMNKTNADVNADGKLNLKDLTTMNRYFAGWDITFGK